MVAWCALATVTPTMAGDVGGAVAEAARTGDTTACEDVETAAEVVVEEAVVAGAVVAGMVVVDAIPR